MSDFAAMTKRYLGDAAVVVVKVGSAMVVDDQTGTIRLDWLKNLAEDLAELKAEGRGILIVSSGAIALGRNITGHKLKRMKIEEKQAAAAIGQISLSADWQKALATHDLKTAQILLSPDDTETRRRHLNARATLLTLLRHDVIPVVNENDTVATTEIRYGDNDRLAARVAAMISADALILLSDIDGLYSSDPRSNQTAQHIPAIAEISDEITAMAGPARRDEASGGMITKIEAARLATAAGCHMAICNGSCAHPISTLKNGGKCSWFIATEKPPQARKRWIASGLMAKGKIMIDKGAVAALRRSKSLLAAGVIKAIDNFNKGDLVAVCDENGHEIGRGLSRYGADDVGRLAGHNSGDIETILGYRGDDEVIHADDLVLAPTEKDPIGDDDAE